MSHFSLFRRLDHAIVASGCGLAMLVGLAVPSPALAAARDLNVEMAQVAKQIKLFLGQKGLNAIAVGDFRGPAKLAASSGPAVSKALADELKNVSITVERRAELEVNGDYRDVNDQKTKLLAVQIKAHIVDRAGQELVAFEPRGILNVTTITSLIGATVALPANATEEARNNQLINAVDHPEVHLAKARIAASADSPYAIEVLVKSGNDYSPRAALQDVDGFAFLKLQRNEIYAIKLINNSPNDAAVTLSIDGLTVFAFSENTNYTHWIVPSRKTLIVPGWHRSNQTSDSFQVTEYSKSAAAEMLASDAPVGTITAGFAAAWPKGENPPEDEIAPMKGGRASDATGRGPSVATSFTEVVREIGRLRTSVSVRYTKEDPNELPPNAKP